MCWWYGQLFPYVIYPILFKDTEMITYKQVNEIYRNIFQRIVILLSFVVARDSTSFSCGHVEDTDCVSMELFWTRTRNDLFNKTHDEQAMNTVKET